MSPRLGTQFMAGIRRGAHEIAAVYHGTGLVHLPWLPRNPDEGTAPWVHVDFMKDRAWRNGALSNISSEVSCNRPGPAMIISGNGTPQGVPAHTLRITHDEISHDPAGVLVEQASINPCKALDYAGAVVGTLGNGGALPTGLTNATSGGTIEVAEVDPGGMTVRYHGHGNDIMQLEWGLPAVAQGDVCTFSFWLREVARAAGSYQVILRVYVYDASFNLLDTQDLAGIEPQDVLFPVEHQFAVTPPGAAYAQLWLLLLPLPGSYDITLRLARQQFERHVSRTSFNAAAARAPDDLTLADSGNLVAQPAWSLVVNAISARAHPTAVLWEVSDGTAANRIVTRLVQGALQLSVIAASAEVATLQLGRWVPMLPGRVAVACTPEGISASYNGRAALSASATPPTGLNQLRLGRGIEGYWNATIAGLTGFKSALSDSALAALTHAPIFWDDFQRADGALSAAPSGHVYAQEPAAGSSAFAWGLCEIAGGKLVLPETGADISAGLNGFAARARIRLFGASFCFTADAGASARMVLIVNPNAPENTGLNLSCIHLPIGRRAMVWQTRTNGVPADVKAHNFPHELAANGTLYHVVARFQGEAVIIRDPFGVLHRARHADFATHGGPFGIFEILYAAGDDGLAVYAVAAE